jgi:hypothetical protein
MRFFVDLREKDGGGDATAVGPSLPSKLLPKLMRSDSPTEPSVLPSRQGCQAYSATSSAGSSASVSSKDVRTATSSISNSWIVRSADRWADGLLTIVR